PRRIGPVSAPGRHLPRRTLTAARHRARRVARRAAEATGLTVLEGTFYDPVPDLDALPPGVFDAVSPLTGITFDVEAQLAWAERELAPHLADFGTGPARWRPRNTFYETGDAEVAHALLRHLRPRRVVELGSGFSTLVLAGALARNTADGAPPARLQVFNPYPPAVLTQGLPGDVVQERRTAQEVPMGVFAALGDGDVLFVDTSHTVKLGGDVNRVVLDVLPTLAPGVVVHFHDVWLPYEYHPHLVRDLGLFWNEQYLLQAFLSMNPGYEVLFATRAVSAAEPERFAALVPGFPPGELFPSSFWIRRT
ncbi:MAG: hypothetical protein JWO90_2984, partial [Solirubrobacterales bacterium]|nr:hypothetical protein [Solirubrobacterales bacterium]